MSISTRFQLLAIAAIAITCAPAKADVILSTLVNFNGPNGDYPKAGLIADAVGNLYGTTTGTKILPGINYDGTVYKISAGTHAFTTVYSFSGANDGNPVAGLITDAAGNLYGTTPNGGANNNGTVFKISAGTNALTTLATFNGTNGKNPYGGLIADAAGNLFGTTQYGASNGKGTVFKISAATNALTTLVTFNGTNGDYSIAGLTADAAGNLYGTTQAGGSTLGSGPNGLGYGTVFEIAAGTNALTTLHSFNSADGYQPMGDLLADAAGNLYGTTSAGGANGHGTVFEIAAGTHAFTTLYSFSGADGAAPVADLIIDAAGNLYGTTQSGGVTFGSGPNGLGYGTVFKIAAGSHALTTLYSFSGADGALPGGSLLADSAGNLYGTTQYGGTSFGTATLGLGYGTVFEISGAGFVVPELGSLSLAMLGGVVLLSGMIVRRRIAGR